jgi:hypothetical protein
MSSLRLRVGASVHRACSYLLAALAGLNGYHGQWGVALLCVLLMALNFCVAWHYDDTVTRISEDEVTL